MTAADERFHKQWLGMVQPSEGLVVSLPVLCDAQCAEKHPREAHLAFLECLEEDPDGKARVSDLGRVFESVLELGPDRFDTGEALPKELSLYVVEGKQRLQPTRALRKGRTPEPTTTAADTTPAAEAGRPYAMLVWEISPEVAQLDKAETTTGDWDYPAQAKFERLLRACRVPIGLLSNGHEVRLVYAPHGESSGWIAFRVGDMASVSGRPIFDAFVMLLSRERWFGVAPEQQLPGILAESRKRNADVTNDLSHQVFEALEVLLAGFSAAEERDQTGMLRAALERGDDHLYAGLLTVLLRLVFLLYCEDRGLLPTEHALFAENYSILGLFDALQADFGKYPDTMHRRFGAYPRLVGLFRAVFLGVSHRDLTIPARRGQLFDPNVYPFLEGWGPEGSAPILQPEDRAAVKLPSVDDHTIYAVLEKLLCLGGQRLSYKALDVEQIGSVYEALMGFAVKRLDAGAVRIRLGSKKGAARVWVEAEALLAVPANGRERWLTGDLGFDKNVAGKIADAIKPAASAAAALLALEPISGRKPERATAGTLVIQPGPERRRTSSHYTPRELTEPIVARTLEPLIAAMGDAPSSETLLNLVVCDPAVGSGAFLVAACRFLADHVVAAWTREGRLELIASAHDDVVNHARRLVAQRCLYGVDKNKYAVQLARLSLWLVTMARNEPFTFVDHAIRHGDSLVGLSFEQLRAFHWKPQAQLEMPAKLLSEALAEAVGIRKKILDLASEGTYAAQREKELLLLDAEDALDRVRLVGDLVVGAFFAKATDKEREKERLRRLDKVEHWLAAEQRGDVHEVGVYEAELRGMQAELRATQVPFHWMIEFPEVFYGERPDPLDGGKRNGAAFVDAFVGNPPFMGGTRISVASGNGYRDWLARQYEASSLTDLCAFFFRRVADLLGSKGTAGLVATNSISQGDSRCAGLSWICRAGGIIYDATQSMPWPGDAAVAVSVVHFSKAIPQPRIVLDGRPVARVTSFLSTRGQEEPPGLLLASKGLAVIGSFVLGIGFVFDDANPGATPTATMRQLVERDSHNRSRIFKYVGGEDLNSSARQTSDRFIIDFGELDEARAREWPELFAIIETKVKPARASVQQRDRREEWWRHATRSPVLRDHMQRHERALAISQVTAHMAFSFIGSDVVVSHTTVAVLLHSDGAFATLQSRIHEPWARHHSSSLETRLRYTPSECFETFPFPHPDPRTVIPSLEAIGEKLYSTRARFMVDTDQGLTKTYNALKDPDSDDPRVLELRALHEEMDRAVVAAYGWELPVPPYCPRTDEERAAVQAFEDAVIDKLFVLNAERAEEERKAGAVVGGKQRGAGKKKAGATGADADAGQVAMFDPAGEAGPTTAARGGAPARGRKRGTT